MPTGISEVIVTADGQEWLAGFTRQLVDERWCACVQHIDTIRSIYRWQGSVEDATEARVALHTRTELVAGLIERIKQDHPYDVPCILAITIEDANPAYVKWIEGETRTIDQPSSPE